MMMVLPAAVNRLEAGRARSHLQPLDEAPRSQEIEHPVDAGDTDGSALGPERVEDLLRGQAAVLPTEQLDHGSSCSAASKPGSMERDKRLFYPVGMRHDVDDSDCGYGN